jgi:molybdopterin synthase sulfur carrier subunit
MEITIRLTKVLSAMNNGKKEACYSLVEGCDMTGLIDILDKDMSGIKKTLLDNNSDIADSINIYVNGENIRYLQGTRTILSDGDQISIIPAAAAG